MYNRETMIFYMQIKFLFIYLLFTKLALETFFFFRSFPFFLLVPTNTWKSQIYSGFNIKSRSKHLTYYYSYTDIIHIHVSLFILFFFSFFYYFRKKLFYSNTALLIRLIVFHLLDKITDDQ